MLRRCIEKQMVALNRKEQERARVLGKLDRGEITADQAAELMGLSLGYVRRLLVRYREKGPECLAHGNRQRKPAHALAPSVTAKVLELAQTRYAGLNLQFLTEKLVEDGVRISRSSVRRILLKLAAHESAEYHPSSQSGSSPMLSD